MSDEDARPDQDQQGDVDTHETAASAALEITATRRATKAIDGAFEAWKPGNPRAEKELFETFQNLAKMAVSHFYRRSNEDLVQKIVSKGFLNLEKFRRRSRISTWFYRIAKNECLKALPEIIMERKMLRIASREDGSEETPKNTIDDIEDTKIRLEDAHSRCDIEKLIAILPVEQLRVVELQLEGYSLEEIADKTKEPIGTTRSRWRLAKEKLSSEVAVRSSQAGLEGGLEKSTRANDIKCVELDLIHQEDSAAKAAPANHLSSSYESIPEESEDEYSLGSDDETSTSQPSA